jgi:hypothetical protein
VGQFGELSVFMDVAAIEVGRDFRKAIDESVAGCGVMLAVIGPAWLDAANDKGESRLADPNDFVRMEIASALKRDIAVIPVLVRGARMPHPNQLPDDLRDLAYRNCVELTHVRWKSDVQVLVAALRLLVAEPTDTPHSSIPPGTAVPSEGDSIGADPCTPAFSPDDLSCLARELAKYIGPIAEIVVKRAARRCSTIAELRRAVADEIDTGADRTSFLDARTSS